MPELTSAVPKNYIGLWERTLLEQYGPGTLTNDRPAEVFWLQTKLWHADIRVPLERPDFSSCKSLDDCDRDQLEFLIGQEGFCGLTRVEGKICSWLRMHDLNPGHALDIGRMHHETDHLIYEYGIAEKYLEHWTLVDGSRAADSAVLKHQTSDQFLLVAGDHAMRLTPRAPARQDADIYRPVSERSTQELYWQASLALSLCRSRGDNWTVQISTHPWLESTEFNHSEYELCNEATLNRSGS